MSARNALRRCVVPQIRQGSKRGMTAYAFQHAFRGNKRVFILGSLGVAGVATCLVMESKKLLAEAVKTDWNKLREDIIEIMEDDDHDDGSFAPIFIRLAWHTSGTWCKHTKTGGSDGGTMRFKPESDHGANAGLHIARNRLEKLAEKYPEVSHADLYVFAGCIAIEEMGGPHIPFRPGRSEAKAESTPEQDKRFSPDGRLPDAALDHTHLRDLFYRMGFNDQDIVALSGAHAVGRCHSTSSGFDGPWTRAPTTFSNEYYRELLENTWTVRKWKGPKQYTDPTGDLMMLETDMALIRDPTFKSYVEIYAKDQDRFYKDFKTAFLKLTELGMKFPESKGESKGWSFWPWSKKTDSSPYVF